jgi:hypothetical protein
VLTLRAIELDSGSMSLQWSDSGAFQAVCNEEYLLLNPGFTVSDQSGKIVYRAPAEYEPPMATMMNPLGGDVTRGNRLEATHKADNTLGLKGFSPGLVDISAVGKLTKESLELKFKTVLKIDHRLVFSFKLIAPESPWQVTPSDDKNVKNLSIRNQGVELNVQSEKGFKFKVQREEEIATVSIILTQSADFSMRFGLIRK